MLSLVGCLVGSLCQIGQVLDQSLMKPIINKTMLCRMRLQTIFPPFGGMSDCAKEIKCPVPGFN